MKLAIVFSRANTGVDAPLVTVEAHLSPGMPKFTIVGLPATAVKESKDRVRSALTNTGFRFPKGRITINLAPADLPKEGGRFDLPIALGILAASKQLPLTAFSEFEFSGELALSGELRPVRGVLPAVIAAKKAKRGLIIPNTNAHEAALAHANNIFAAEHLLEVCAFLKEGMALSPCEFSLPETTATHTIDLQDVRGQRIAKRALEIAAAGRHNLLFIGPPGTGKTMLASRLPTILPPLEENEALEIAAIASLSHKGFDVSEWQIIPFRSPHHTASSIALVGGGRPPKPGEISLAHHGILFLDELPEYGRQVLECLREPLESGCITISRASYQTIFPAQFQLVSAMNPCPCGFFGSETTDCRCTGEQVQRYLAKLSGPLLDRIDMHVEVPSLRACAIASEPQGETSAAVKERVLAVRNRQWQRQQKSNAELTVAELTKHCLLTKPAEALLSEIMQKFNFSARVFHRIVKVAKTIADHAVCDIIDSPHISEALTYRHLDKAKLTF